MLGRGGEDGGGGGTLWKPQQLAVSSSSSSSSSSSITTWIPSSGERTGGGGGGGGVGCQQRLFLVQATQAQMKENSQHRPAGSRPLLTRWARHQQARQPR